MLFLLRQKTIFFTKQPEIFPIHLSDTEKQYYKIAFLQAIIFLSLMFASCVLKAIANGSGHAAPTVNHVLYMAQCISVL